jgi:hypothetical protein
VQPLTIVRQISEHLEQCGSIFQKHNIYHIKDNYFFSVKAFCTQPVVLLLLTVWLIVLIRALWTDDYIKKFGFMTLYSCIDLLTLILQDGFYSYAFTLKK